MARRRHRRTLLARATRLQVKAAPRLGSMCEKRRPDSLTSWLGTVYLGSRENPGWGPPMTNSAAPFGQQPPPTRSVAPRGAAPPLKRCPHCGIQKPTTAFHIDRYRASGLANWCKPCRRARSRKAHLQERHADPEHAAQACRDYRAAHPEASRQADHRSYRKKVANGAAQAKRKVRDALRSGMIERCPCEGCGATSNLHAHHDDYSKPLEVRWLCRTCHGRHHRLLRDAARANTSAHGKRTHSPSKEG